MTIKKILVCGVAVFAATGVTVSVVPQIDLMPTDEGVPFLMPSAGSASICSSKNASATRRAFFIRTAKAYAQATADTDAEPIAFSPYENISYSISTKSDIAQSLFDRGLALTWNFNHGDAIKAFKAAQAEDPDCAMCYWGEAFAYGPNINAGMPDEAYAPAYAALSIALEKLETASEKERGLIKALQKRYVQNPLKDRSPLDNAFADAMADVAQQFPDDDFLATLAVEANMDTQPWDYWSANGASPKGRTAESLSLLEAVLERNPDYHAAIHLYIHMTEASRNPHRAAKFAEKLGDLSPGLGHLIHMPSHTYYVIGRYKEALASNVKAIAADEAFFEKHETSPFYEFGYFTHNVHFALTSAQMAGDGKTTLAMAKKLDAKLPMDMARAVPFAQPIKAAPYYAMVLFDTPDTILALDDPGADLPFLQASWRYARGEALARSGDPDGARKEAEAIGKIVATADLSALEENGIPALDVLNISRLAVIARAALAENDLVTAIEALEEAVILEEGLTYMEPPYWYYPIKQTLAATLIKSGDTERAEHLLINALAKNPNNGWVLYGLAESYAARGDKKAAKYARTLFKDAWLGDASKISLDNL